MGYLLGRPGRTDGRRSGRSERVRSSRPGPSSVPFMARVRAAYERNEEPTGRVPDVVIERRPVRTKASRSQHSDGSGDVRTAGNGNLLGLAEVRRVTRDRVADDLGEPVVDGRLAHAEREGRSRRMPEWPCGAGPRNLGIAVGFAWRAPAEGRNLSLISPYAALRRRRGRAGAMGSGADASRRRRSSATLASRAAMRSTRAGG